MEEKPYQSGKFTVDATDEITVEFHTQQDGKTVLCNFTGPGFYMRVIDSDEVIIEMERLIKKYRVTP